MENKKLTKKLLCFCIEKKQIEYDKIKQQIKILSSAIEKINHQVLWLWPNIDAGTDLISKYLRKLREKNKLENVTFLKNFEAEDYLVILENALCAIEIVAALLEKDLI